MAALAARLSDRYRCRMDHRNLPSLDGAVWRALVPGDAEAMADLHNACFEVDRTYRITSGEMRDEFDRFGEHADEDSIGAFAKDGSMLALGWCGVPPGAETEHRGFVWILVHPEIRGRIDDALLEWVETAGSTRLRSFDDGLPAALYRYEILDGMVDEAALLERHGFVPARYFTENLRDLSLPIDAAPLAGGLSTRSWTEEVSGDALTVHNAAFADHWASQPIAPEQWASYHDNEFFLPQTSLVVYDGDQPVAYMQCSRFPHDWDDRGRTEAWIEGVGTIRSHRGRGIASALITMAMRAFREDDMEYAILGVDSENPSGANRIYERLGFVPERRSTAFRKPVQ